ncbi:MAG TPA: hypothetical protein VMT45_08150 [Thermoanaerobaculaceae bacterium]|nr:hypothetical protein [Thermoanaerobaculaceae bacterium]
MYSKRCPLCGRSVALQHRRRFDHIVALVVPVHRWQCQSCEWTGLRIDRHELKKIKRRVSIVVIVILAFLIGLVAMWYLDYLKYTKHPPDEEPGVESPQ